MSGGSMDYLYHKIENDANFRLSSPLRRAFKDHLTKVCKALHDIEWVDSCDYGPGDENKAIEACLAPGASLKAAIDEARKVQGELTAEMERATADGGDEHG